MAQYRPTATGSSKSRPIQNAGAGTSPELFGGVNLYKVQINFPQWHYPGLIGWSACLTEEAVLKPVSFEDPALGGGQYVG
jgi:hypothetical protein